MSSGKPGTTNYAVHIVICIIANNYSGVYDI